MLPSSSSAPRNPSRMTLAQGNDFFKHGDSPLQKKNTLAAQVDHTSNPSPIVFRFCFRPRLSSSSGIKFGKLKYWPAINLHSSCEVDLLFLNAAPHRTGLTLSSGKRETSTTRCLTTVLLNFRQLMSRLERSAQQRRHAHARVRIAMQLLTLST